MAVRVECDKQPEGPRQLRERVWRLRYREAKAVYEKMEFWSIRTGITKFRDE